MTERKLDGRVAIVTGGARGMGAAHVEALVEAGASVLCTDVLDEEGEALVARLPAGKALYHHLDVTDAEAWANAVATAEERLGPLSILVNNAGIFRMAAIEKMPVADFRAVLDINAVGTFLGMQAAFPSIRTAGGGAIVNISSTAGFAGAPYMAAYVASKFAIRGMTKVAALEFGKAGVRVNSIHPGAIATKMTEGAGAPAVPIPRFADPAEVAKLMLFLVGDDSSFCTGSEFTIDGGFLCVVGENTFKAAADA